MPVVTVLRLLVGVGGAMLGTWGAISAAQALDLEAARGQGWICEAPNGYVRALSASAEVATLVSVTNERRRALYQSSAERQGVSLAVVEAISAATLQQKHPACP